jgi:arylsulfatase A-like enzyme
MTGIDDYVPMHDLYLESASVVDVLFAEDHDIATVSWNRALKQAQEGSSYSLYLPRVYDTYKKWKTKKLAEIATNFPRGLPNYDGNAYFTLEAGIDGVLDLIGGVSNPFLGYYHFLPPHNPFKTRADFFNKFAKDDHSPPGKPEDHLFFGDTNQDELLKRRRLYDEFILYVDYEFARLYEHMERNGLLENTWLILTSDHGEMFERGILGHMTPSLHQPIIRIPLVVFPPGGKARVDVYDTTSAIDLLPTLMHVTGQDVPDWAEGVVLPPFSTSTSSSDRDVYALQVGDIDKNGRITSATVMLVRGRHKLMWYFGYGELDEEGDLVELYDILADPEELHNLFPSRQDLANRLLRIAKSKLEEKNQ